MSNCPECGTYSEIRSTFPNCLVCPNCKAMFRKKESRYQDMTVDELKDHIFYLQDAILELGRTSSNIMERVKDNKRSINRLKGKL